jgi:hypothetical protein
MVHKVRMGTRLAGEILVLGEGTILVVVVGKACQETQLRVAVGLRDPIVLGRLGAGRTEEGTVAVVGRQGRLGSAGLGSVVAPVVVGTVVHLALEAPLAVEELAAAAAELDEIPNLEWQGHLAPVAACSPSQLELPRSASL